MINVSETSQEALQEIKPHLSDRHEAILRVLKEVCRFTEDASDYEIARYMGKDDPNYVRPRRHELVNEFKLVGFSRKRICHVTGKTVLTWKILKIRGEV